PDDPEQTEHIANDCGAKILFVHTRERLEAFLKLRDELDAAEEFVLIDDEAEPGDGYRTFEELLEEGTGADPDDFNRQARSAEPDDLATFIYTSGTTGLPKGVMLSHWNIASNVQNALQMMDIEPDQTALSFLPLSHSFERTVDYIYFYRGVSVAYAESIEALGENLMEVRPHLFVSVPRVYEKLLGKIYEGAQASPLKKKLLDWAVDTGRKALPHRLRQESPPGLLGIQLALADKLVFGKVRKKLGGRFEFAISGGAPLGKELGEFFWGAGFPIYEGYGLTETSPVLTVNSPDRVKLGTVGTAVPETKLEIADDGEILARGPQVMQGYYNLPDATAEAIDDAGWFHTGDIGQIDEEGFLSITDRKKEIIVNAYGKNVPPAKVENAVKNSLYVSQAVAIGDKKKMIAALVVPDFDALESWAGSQGISFQDREELLESEQVQKLFEEEIEQANEKLAHYEEVKAWTLLAEEFSIEGGELTPTQKVKRRVIDEKYEEEIDRMYERAEARHG
ncbi:MAG: long-chain fatty acid--CoA ligase, partial [Thermoanaerobaculia bacterium]|nr:long-chain fatty acid--CoA ligase [Thermoanaerobaculia bacterium]